MERVASPTLGSIVEYLGDKTPYDVYIVSGEYLDPQYQRLSNNWTWRELLPDGKLGPEKSGYGNFAKSNKKYKIEITWKIVKDHT